MFQLAYQYLSKIVRLYWLQLENKCNLLIKFAGILTCKNYIFPRYSLSTRNDGRVHVRVSVMAGALTHLLAVEVVLLPGRPIIAAITAIQ